MSGVLHIISDTNIGGAGRSLLTYLSCCDRDAFSPLVALPRGSALLAPLSALEVPVREMDRMADRSLSLPAVPALARLIRETDPELVHTHGSLSGRLAARLRGKKVVYTKHCAFPPGALAASPPGRLAGRIMDACLSDAVIAIGPSAREILRATGIPDRKIHVLFNGVAPLPRPRSGEREELRRQWGFEPEDFVLGILARVEPYKGHDVLLDALSLLLAQGRRVKVLVAGTGSGEQALRRRALEEFPEGAVRFAGFVEQVERALWCMDAQVNASTQSETSSLSLLEGMSLGLPAIVSDVGGNPQLIRDGENGLVFPNGDAAALARCAGRLMDEADTLRSMGERAEEIFGREFTAQRYAGNIEAVYRTVLEGN